MFLACQLVFSFPSPFCSVLPLLSLIATDSSHLFASLLKQASL